MELWTGTGFRKIVILERTAFKLATDRRAMATALTGHFLDLEIMRDKAMKTPPIGEGRLLIAPSHSKISKGTR